MTPTAISEYLTARWRHTDVNVVVDRLCDDFVRIRARRGGLVVLDQNVFVNGCGLQSDLDALKLAM